MPEFQCPAEGCTHMVPDLEPVLQAAMLNTHTMDKHSQQPAQPQGRRRPPQVDRPKLTDNMSEVGWNAFLQDWETFVRANNIVEVDRPTQLFACCDGELKTKTSSLCHNVYEKTVPEMMTMLKNLAVIPVATSVKCNELLQMQQNAGESIRAFHARLKGKAATCNFVVNCTHPHQHDDAGNPRGNLPVEYTDCMIRHVILNGLYDGDIGREVFSMTDVDAVTNNVLVTRIEAKETAREAISTVSKTSAVSQYKKQQKDERSRNVKEQRDHVKEPPFLAKQKVDFSLEGKCSSCGTRMKLYKKMRQGKPNRTPFSECVDCWRKSHTGENNGVNEIEIVKESSIAFDISGIVGSAAVTPTVGLPPAVDTEDDEYDLLLPSTENLMSVLEFPYSVPTVSLFAEDDDDAIMDDQFTITAIEHFPEKDISSTPMSMQSIPNKPLLVEESDDSLVVIYNRFTVMAPSSVAGETPVDPPLVINNIESGILHVAGMNTEEREIVLSHHIFKDGSWIPKSNTSHPKLRLEARTNDGDYRGFGLENPKSYKCTFLVEAITDSGAQCCVWGWVQCQAAGFTLDDLIPVKQKLNGVSKSRIEIYGAVILRMSGTTTSTRKIGCAAIVYVSPSISGFYLSEDAMKQLKIIPPDFPKVGSACSMDIQPIEPSEPSEEDTQQTTCTCIPRTATPGRPEKLPFDATPENVQKMEEYLLKRYASSTFNKCPHHIIPEIPGPPVTIHVDPKATPVCVRVPSQIPIHLEEDVKKGLDNDVAMGVIEKVPHNEPSKWCHRMVLGRKDNGGFRRTVDLSPLNKHCVREVHAMRSPFELAKGVPAGTYRTVSDAWNGFHSMGMRMEDRHLTTFITPWGRYRYKRAPQGFASSGDGYNRRMDDILCEYPRHKRCVDDNLCYDEDIEQHWWRVIDYLELMGKNGIIINPEKFQFCRKEVDFAGFRIKETRVEPLPKYYNAIRDFPTPRSTTDIRSWFSLVNQVAHYAQLRDMLEPFRKFMSPKVKFNWDETLDKLFEESKLHIINAIKEGVEIFDPKKKTCLRCDWSKKGIGFYLCQKHCSCKSETPDCCDDGWKITVCGSRFLKKNEERYAPIEGEALGVAWALDQTKFFTLGCADLVVIVDHKPLTKTLGDRTLDEIDNTRLFRIKQKTLPWLFKILWLPGKVNHFSDAVSRYPSKNEDVDGFAALVISMMETSIEEEKDIASLQAKSDLNRVVAVTWDMVQEATYAESAELMSSIQRGFCDNVVDFNKEFPEFKDYRSGLYVHDHAIMYQNRVFIPPSLRPAVLETLHAAHQGETGMSCLARSTVFWPGITANIQKTRKSCEPCTRNAPSQPKIEPIPPIVPTTPFEAIVADYFDYIGKHYLVVADRLSAWTEAYQIHVGSEDSGSRGLMSLLKRFFGTFGVPVEISSDGGKEFTSDETGDFFQRWGINHRVSASYNPQSNGRAELAVKSTKRLLENNIGPDGKLDTENFLRALLIKRNTPDPGCKLSPAEIIFGRNLRDTLPRIDKRVNVFYNERFRSSWREAWEQKELALRMRYHGCEARLREHSKSLPPLKLGDRVVMQNQNGQRPNKWERTGNVVEIRDFDKYIVKVDGSGRLTMRNRRFLKPIFIDGTMFGPIKPVHKKKTVPLPAKQSSGHSDEVPSTGGCPIPLANPVNRSVDTELPMEEKSKAPTTPARVDISVKTPGKQTSTLPEDPPATACTPRRHHVTVTTPGSKMLEHPPTTACTPSPHQQADNTASASKRSAQRIPCRRRVLDNVPSPRGSTPVRQQLQNDAPNEGVTSRPSRRTKPTLVYDASRGEYVERNAGENIQE